MCGIGVLIASRSSAACVAELVVDYMSVVRHRGPDDEGYALADFGGPVRSFAGDDTPDDVVSSHAKVEGRTAVQSFRTAKVALGHRRLSILDVSASGHQPMVSDDGRWTIVYNGEIYNFEAIRSVLEKSGHRFHSHSDTEVVLHAFIAWGVDCVRRFNGMFAFVIYDAQRKRIFAARDRFGVKPLYMWLSPDGLFAIASEIKQLTTLPQFQARLNGQRAYDFLNWALTDHTSQTLFEGVTQLRGGEYVEAPIDDLRALPRPVPWYTLTPARERTDSFEEASQRVRELFLDSVALRMRADVSVGTALSGGLDSSSIVCAVNDRRRRAGSTTPQRSFSACSHEARFDERKHVEKVVAATNVDAHYVYPTVDGLFEALDAMTWHQDEPFGGTSNFAEWSVFQLVSSTPVKVTLDGHGADELFGGYPSFYGPRLLELMKRGRGLELAREALALRRRHRYTPRLLAGALLNAGVPNATLQQLRNATGRISQDAAWFRHDRHAVDPSSPSDPFFRESQSVAGYSRALLLATSLPQQLRWADRDSMAHSIESRTPFLDYRLIEYVLGCPPEFKIRNGVTKAILREAMADLLPPAIAQRPDKMGFVTAEESWMLRDARPRFRAEVDDAFAAAADVMNEGARDRAVDILEGREPFNLFVWRLISFGRWARRFRVSA